MNKRPLAPGFINKLDRWLLLNRPDTWATRIHLVLYYLLLFIAVFTLISFLLPENPLVRTYMPFVSVGIGLLALMGLIVWLIYLFRFNVFKQFGIVKAGDRIKNFVFFYVTIFSIACTVIIPEIVETIRVNSKFSSDELMTDMNRMNELISRLEYNAIPHDWNVDTLVVYKHIAGENDYPVRRYDSDTAIAPAMHYTYVDSSELSWQLSSADSILKLNDTMYRRLNFFNLDFIGQDNRISAHSPVPFLHTIDLYHLVFKNPGQPNRDRLKQELSALIVKYGGEKTFEPYSEVLDLRYRIMNKYNLYAVNNSFDNISDKKYWPRRRDIRNTTRVFHYITLALTLLLFMFRHTTIRTFFLTILALVILSVLTGIFLAMTRAKEMGIFITLLIYFAIFFTQALMTFRSRKRHFLTGISINIILLLVTFIPMICVALRHAILREAYRSRMIYEYYDYDPDFSQHMLLAEIAGVVLLLILTETLFKRLYRSWYALPEE